MKHFIKLVGNSALKKTILSWMWRNIAFPCDWVFSHGFFFLFCLFFSSFKVCVIPFSITWTIASAVKTVVLYGLPVSSIYQGANNSLSESFINSSISSSFSFSKVTNNANIWLVEALQSYSLSQAWPKFVGSPVNCY